MANNTSTGATSSIKRFSTIATDPLRNFRYIVIFEDTADGPAGSYMSFGGGFTQVSGLNIATSSISYREGGMNTSLHQVPGQTSFQPIGLTRGAIYGNSEAINWMRQLYAAASGEGIPGNKNFRCNVTIYVLDHPIVGSPELSANDIISKKAYKMKFKAYNAWITNLSYSDLNASDNGIMYESIQLVHEGLTAEYVK